MASPNMFVILLITCSLIDIAFCLEGSPAASLEILPEAIANGHNILLRRVEESLNLTCRIVSRDDDTELPNYKLSWHLPHLMQQNSQNRVQDHEDGPNSQVLAIQNLKESDTGDYECQARLGSSPGQVLYNKIVRLNVKNKKGSCGDQMFMCPSGLCIMRRFMCDGRKDCKNGADEDHHNCGQDPCEGKLTCPNEGRCIPKHWCCDQFQHVNCTVKIKPACCGQLAKAPAGFGLHPDFDISEQRFNDMGFLQTTIYTVIGCAMAFMFIVTILVIAICRVHMKRSLLSRCPNSRSRNVNGRARNTAQQIPLYDLDVFLNRTTFPPDSASPHSGLLVTYNINNGIQFVGHPVDPPPYCEVVAAPPREGPPPPYASRENLQEVITSPSRSVHDGFNQTRRQSRRSLCRNSAQDGQPCLQVTEDSLRREDGIPNADTTLQINCPPALGDSTFGVQNLEDPTLRQTTSGIAQDSCISLQDLTEVPKSSLENTILRENAEENFPARQKHKDVPTANRSVCNTRVNPLQDVGDDAEFEPLLATQSISRNTLRITVVNTPPRTDGGSRVRLATLRDTTAPRRENEVKDESEVKLSLLVDNDDLNRKAD